LPTLRALGAVSTDWPSFFESPDENPFRAFFTHHPDLHTIGIGWEFETMYSEVINPVDLATLFPSLIHLEAPAFLCAPIMASSLADQIESVAILDEWYEPMGPNLNTTAQAARLMPELRRLALHQNEDRIDTRALKRLLSVTPELQELKFMAMHDQLVRTRSVAGF
jgi:hypothetical protein